jgi:hypothetical protein
MATQIDPTQRPPVEPIPADLEDFRPSPKWPKVIGIISIAWASLGLVCGGCGVLFTQFGAGMVPPEMKDQMPPMTMIPMQWAQMLLSVVLSFALIVAGGMLIARKPLGRTLHIWIAIASLLLLPFFVYIQSQVNARNMDWARDNPTVPAAKAMLDGGNPGQIIGYALAIVLGSAYPIFLLIWFLAVKRKASDLGANEEYV